MELAKAKHIREEGIRVLSLMAKHNGQPLRREIAERVWDKMDDATRAMLMLSHEMTKGNN